MEDEARWEIHGDPTEGALVVAGEKAGMAHEELVFRALSYNSRRLESLLFALNRGFLQSTSFLSCCLSLLREGSTNEKVASLVWVEILVSLTTESPR